MIPPRKKASIWLRVLKYTLFSTSSALQSPAFVKLAQAQADEGRQEGSGATISPFIKRGVLKKRKGGRGYRTALRWNRDQRKVKARSLCRGQMEAVVGKYRSADRVG